MASTCGFSGLASKRLAPADRQSKNRRRDSANRVSRANVLFPLPLGPTKAISFPAGNVRLMLRSVFRLAPVMRMSNKLCSLLS